MTKEELKNDILFYKSKDVKDIPIPLASSYYRSTYYLSLYLHKSYCRLSFKRNNTVDSKITINLISYGINNQYYCNHD